MRIENVVEVDAPVDRVWALVNDIPRVAPCMPGAALTNVVDGQTYEGTVAVKLGPLRMSYKGTVVIQDVDEAGRSARLAASGKDTKGAGTARATVDTRLEPVDDARTRMSVTSDVQLTGRVASFGRGGAINDVATRLFREFADCLRATLEAEQAPAAAPTSPAAGEPAAPGAADGATAPAAPDAGEPAAPAAETPAATVTPPAAPVHAAPPQAPRPLDAGSLAGTVIVGRLRAFFQAIAAFFRRLFGRGSRA
jgi:carbon monoxide dehydrogenase subunit G